MTNVLQSFVYVENCSLAHLEYERRLIGLQSARKRDDAEKPSANLLDIGGDAFTVCDAGPPITYGDVYTLLQTLTAGESTFMTISPTAMLLLAHLVESYYLIHYRFTHSSISYLRSAGRLLPSVKGVILGLQPSAFPFTLSHLVFSDARARLSPSSGGLGYSGPYTTAKGLCKLVEEYEKGGRRAEERSLTLGLGMDAVQSAVITNGIGDKMVELGEKIAEEAVTLAN
jgi:hypothetical protein